MAYNTRYESRFESDNGTTYRIRLKRKEATEAEGEVKHRALGQAPVLKQEKRGHIFGTSLNMYLECIVDQEFAELYDSDPTAWKVELFDENTSRLVWEGFLVPELYSEPDIAPPYDVQIIATDGIGELKFHDFSYTEYRFDHSYEEGNNWGTFLKYLLSFTELGWSSDRTEGPLIITSAQIHEYGHDFEPFIPAALTNYVKHYDGMTMYDILETVLTLLNLYIVRHDNRWLLLRQNDFAYYEAYGKIIPYNSWMWDGFYYGDDNGLIAKLQGEWWPVGQLSTAVEPAKNSLGLTVDYRYRQSMLGNSRLGDAVVSGDDPDRLTTWSVYGQVQNYTMNEGFDSQGKYHVGDAGFMFGTLDSQIASSGSMRQTVDIPEITKPLKMTVRACSMYDAAPFGDSFNPELRLTVMRQSAGRTYYLHYVEPDELSSGGYAWTTELSFIPLSLTKYYPQKQDKQPRELDEFNILFPPCAQGSLQVSLSIGSAIYAFIGYCGIGPAEGLSPKGLKVSVAIDNHARSAAEEVTLDTLTGNDEAITVYNGILKGSHGLCIDTVRDDVITAQRSAEYIAMDYAREVALPRLRVKGTLNFPKGARLPRVFIKGGNPYLIEESSWDLWSDELEVDMVSLPATNPQITGLTVTTKEY